MCHGEGRASNGRDAGVQRSMDLNFALGTLPHRMRAAARPAPQARGIVSIDANATRELGGSLRVRPADDAELARGTCAILIAGTSGGDADDAGGLRAALSRRLPCGDARRGDRFSVIGASADESLSSESGDPSTRRRR